MESGKTNTKTRWTVVIGIAALGCLLAGPVGAQIVVNGDFETGDFTGWGQINAGSGGIVIDDGTFLPPCCGAPVPPFQASFGSATWQTGPGIHTLFQDVTIPPALVAPTLFWADHIENWAGVFSDPNQEWRVEVWNPANNAVLAELFSTNPGDPTLQPWTVRSADLSPWSGQTIRLAFTEEDNFFFFNARLDAVDIREDCTPTSGCRVNGRLGPCLGTPGSDVIIGTSRRDRIDGRGGDDYIVGLEKRDLLCGGGGDDVLIGGPGADSLFGENGDDILEGLGGRDLLNGGPGNDKLDGGRGRDTCLDPNDGNQTYPFQSCEITP